MNEIKIFEGHKVEVLELNGQVLFNPYHVGECLELSDSAVRNYLSKMNEKQAVILKNSDVRNKDIRNLNNAGEKFLTESGVYKLVFKSRKPNAEAFTDWVTDEVLPSIHKHGIYATDKVIDDILNNPDFGIQGEEWRNIDGYEGKYMVSNLGRVKSLNYKHTKKSHLLSQTMGSKGYLYVTLSKNGKRKLHLVHIIVAKAFVPNQNNLPTVNHMDECKTNNRADNLEWLSYRDNNLYGSHYKRVSESQLNDPKKSKRILQYDLSGNFIKEWESAQEIQRRLKINNSNIIQNCRENVKTAGGFILNYAT